MSLSSRRGDGAEARIPRHPTPFQAHRERHRVNRQDDREMPRRAGPPRQGAASAVSCKARHRHRRFQSVAVASVGEQANLELQLVECSSEKSSLPAQTLFRDCLFLDLSTRKNGIGQPRHHAPAPALISDGISTLPPQSSSLGQLRLLAFCNPVLLRGRQSKTPIRLGRGRCQRTNWTTSSVM
jgi:hypothetical protein